MAAQQQNLMTLGSAAWRVRMRSWKVNEVIRIPLSFKQSSAVTLKEKYQQLGDLWNFLHCISEKNQSTG